MRERKYTIESFGSEIDNFLSSLVEKAGFGLNWDLSEDSFPHPDIQDPELTIQFSGEDVDLLLANRAELLLAVEHLTMEALGVPHEDHERLCFDANDYRMLRIAELRSSALTAADKVKSTQAPFRFSPMTSRERRIIHLALRNEPAVRSESEGFDPRRNVVIYPAGMPSAPAAARPATPMRRGRRR